MTPTKSKEVRYINLPQPKIVFTEYDKIFLKSIGIKHD